MPPRAWRAGVPLGEGYRSCCYADRFGVLLGAPIPSQQSAQFISFGSPGHEAQRHAPAPRPRAATSLTHGTARSHASYGPNRTPVGSMHQHDRPLGARSRHTHPSAVPLRSAPGVRRGVRSCGPRYRGRAPQDLEGPHHGVVNGIAPEIAGLGLPATGIEHRQRIVVGKDLGRRQHRGDHQFVKRCQPAAGGAHPIAQG